MNDDITSLDFLSTVPFGHVYIYIKEVERAYSRANFLLLSPLLVETHFSRCVIGNVGAGPNVILAVENGRNISSNATIGRSVTPINARVIRSCHAPPSHTGC